MSKITVREFSHAIRCHESMASRIRSGDRCPGVKTLRLIHEAYDIPLDDLLAAHSEGPEAFGVLIRERVFGNT